MFIRCQFMESRKLVFVAMVTASTRQRKFYKFCFIHCIQQPNLRFKPLIFLELFRVTLSKCRHYTPERRFQTTNRET